MRASSGKSRAAAWRISTALPGVGDRLASQASTIDLLARGEPVEAPQRLLEGLPQLLRRDSSFQPPDARELEVGEGKLRVDGERLPEVGVAVLEARPAGARRVVHAPHAGEVVLVGLEARRDGPGDLPIGSAHLRLPVAELRPRPDDEPFHRGDDLVLGCGPFRRPRRGAARSPARARRWRWRARRRRRRPRARAAPRPPPGAWRSRRCPGRAAPGRLGRRPAARLRAGPGRAPGSRARPGSSRATRSPMPSSVVCPLPFSASATATRKGPDGAPEGGVSMRPRP